MNIRRLQTSLFALFTILFLAGCMPKVEGPGIWFGQSKYGFGTIAEGNIVNHTFEFTNNGNQDLVIDDVHPTCGCTVAGDYDKNVKPGQTGKIPLSFRTSGYDGKVTKTITVKTNVPDKRELSLILEGSVKISIGVNPRVLFLGNLERNRTTPVEGKIAISNRMQSPFKITNIEVTNNNVEAKVDTVKDGYEYSLNITVKPPFKDGQVMETVLLKTDSKLKSEINTQFSYYMEPLVKVYPNPLFVSMDSIAKGTEQVINIQGQPEVNIRISDIESNFAQVKTSLKENQKGQIYGIVVKFPKDFAFDQNKVLTIKFKVKNVPNEPTYTVPIYKM
jgi:hypothetical protein